MALILSYATGILLNTPLWVYGLLALLIWLGSRGLNPRAVGLRRIAIVPAIFILWGLSGLLGRPFDTAAIAGLWLAGAGGGAMIGLLTGPRLAGADRARGRVDLPASWWPLLRNLIFFFAHYALNVTAAILPAMAADLQRAGIAVSGASAGISSAGA